SRRWRSTSTTRRTRSGTSTQPTSSPRRPGRWVKARIRSMSQRKTLREISCADDYDPDSMPVDRARELIRTFLVPVTATERVHLRAALGRVLATDIVSPVAVPAHDNSAMDGYAVRFADLAAEGET